MDIMKEDIIKNLIRHTFLLSEEVKEKLLSIHLTDDLLERLWHFFEHYGAHERAIIEAVSSDVSHMERSIRGEIERNEGKKEVSEIEDLLSSI